MASPLVSAAEYVGVEDEEWIFLSPDVPNQYHTEYMQTAWKILLDSLFDQISEMGDSRCKCGCVGIYAENTIGSRRINQQALVRDFQTLFEGSENSANTVARDLADISSRISSLEVPRRSKTQPLENRIGERRLHQNIFILRSQTEFEAAMTFFMGWLAVSNESMNLAADMVIVRLCTLFHNVPETVKVPPLIKFRYDLTVEWWCWFFYEKRKIRGNDNFAELLYTYPTAEPPPVRFRISSIEKQTQDVYHQLIVETPSGGKHQLEPDLISQKRLLLDNSKLLPEEPWHVILAEAAKYKDASQLQEVLFTTKHIALRLFDRGKHSEALGLFMQILIFDCVFFGSRTRQIAETLEQLATLAFCCHEIRFAEHFLQKRKEVCTYLSDAPPLLPKVYPLFRPINEFFHDSLDLTSIYSQKTLLHIFVGLNDHFPPQNEATIPRCKLRRAVSQRFQEAEELTLAEQQLRLALKDLDQLDMSRSSDVGNRAFLSDESDHVFMRVLIELDLAIVLTQSPEQTKRDEAENFGQNAFRGIVKRAQMDRTCWADVLFFRDVLLRYGISHWSFDRTAKAPFTIKDTLGSGAYSIVNAVTWTGDDSTVPAEYAQKIFRIPARSANKSVYMASINNELNSIRKLKQDPHLVRIEYTYTESQTFVAILSPRADEDLQSYLERQNIPIECPNDWKCQCPNHINAVSERMRENKSIKSWFFCLAKSLAKIHNQGVRHKDIKSRNILVKDSQVLYADFGSSAIFESELTSSTAGTVNSGNTPMFSAPEVVANQKRSRSADIFSLGCVFTEMLVVKDGATLAEYHEFRTSTFKDEWGVDYQTCAYHSTLEKVDQWFDSRSTGFQEYQVFVKPMLAVDRLQRPSAEKVVTAIRKYYFDVESITCSSCDPSWKSLSS